MSRAQIQQNARDWAAETEDLGRLAQAATEGYSPRFRRQLQYDLGRAVVRRDSNMIRCIEGIEQEAAYVDNWLDREDHFGRPGYGNENSLSDHRANPYTQL